MRGRLAKRFLFTVASVIVVTGALAGVYTKILFTRLQLAEPAGAGIIQQALEARTAHDHEAFELQSAQEAARQPARDGAIIAMLSIPRLGLSTLVVEGSDAGELRVAPGHIQGTAEPGQHGNIGIAAHRDTFFRPLRFIRKGDVIGLTTVRGTYRYQVVATEIIRPDDVRVLYPTGRDVLTLVTCYPFFYVGSAPERFILRAEPLA